MAKKSKRLKQRQQHTTTSTPPSTTTIADLPDSILSHILSFLPTETAVSTSILSQRWRHLWQYLQVFNFINGGAFGYDEDSMNRFSVFVYSALSLRRSRDILKFRLTSDYCPASDKAITTWIRSAVGPHLQELQLFLVNDFNFPEYEDSMFPIPLTLFTCTGLVSLSLTGAVLIQNLASPIHLPSLKNLKLRVDYVGPINLLLSGCPVLETLNLCFIVTPRSREICFPSTLKRLTYEDETSEEIQGFKLDTQFLECLELCLSTKCSGFSVTNLHNVLKAHLVLLCQANNNNNVFYLAVLRALTRVKFLELHFLTPECVLYAPVVDFPEFGFLVRLKLTIEIVNSKFLVNLLQKCSVLKFLTVQKQEKYQQEPFSLGCWTQPINDPNCLLSHLLNFEFLCYQDSADERAFISYILQRGLVLKAVTIQTNITPSLGSEAKHNILKELSIIPRGSNMCQLSFV